LWFPGGTYDNAELQRFMDRLAMRAAHLGYVTKSGRKAGRGNVRRLLEAIANDEVKLVEKEGCNG
jgi:hypothetical protein